MAVRIISDSEVIRLLTVNHGAYAFWLGAGTSREAGLETADEICFEIKSALEKQLSASVLADKAAVDRWAVEQLKWNDLGRRYTTCIRRGYPALAQRVRYFRELLGRKSVPSFSHHATALLMRWGLIKNTCLTTNFDHLIENAFITQEEMNCQAIRSEHEVGFWNSNDVERYFILKLHGDIDTENILNTQDETIRIGERMARAAETVLSNAGLVVLGAAGHETSVRNLFQNLERRARDEASFLGFGVLWGVYMGQDRRELADGPELDRAVRERIEATRINEDIVELMDRNSQQLFCFFPVWGAGNFLNSTVSAMGSKGLEGTAARYLDHGMRLRRVFAGAGLSEATVSKHLESLRVRREAIRDREEQRSPPPRFFGQATVPSASTVRLLFLYGDISSRSLLADARFRPRRSAVVSAEDIYLSVGGGVALTLLEKAGATTLLHELSKLSPVAQCSVAVTSAGNLPIQYVFHAAALRIDEGPQYRMTQEDVRNTMTNVLRVAAVLDVAHIWVPLLGTGTAGLKPAESLMGLISAVREWAQNNAGSLASETSVAVTIYNDGELSRESVAASVQQVLGAGAYAEVQEEVPAYRLDT
ncbi:MAG: macro domain-containing protein [Longimicrobiales bacterium]